MRELGADGAAVGVFELRDDLAQFQLRRELAGTRAREEFRVEIGLAETKIRKLEHSGRAAAAGPRDRAWR